MSLLLSLSLLACRADKAADSSVADSGEACVSVIGYADLDGDGFGDATASLEGCELPSGYVENADDCDDASADAFPGNTEVCDGIDNDCDGLADDETATDARVWYGDGDADGYGHSEDVVTACDQPDGYVDNADDCDPYDDDSYPGGVELCDGADNDCDGAIDEETDDSLLFYADTDGDGFGDASSTIQDCDRPDGYVWDDTDCDDTTADISPVADEYCDDIDNDCDGDVDEVTAVDAATWYADTDSDGYGDVDSTTEACDQPSSYVDNADDCDDSTGDTSPDADETCDGIDNDCDGDVDEDEATDATTWYADDDGDTYGDASSTTAACSQPDDFVADATDCNDNRDDIHPGADEYCDGVDTDCDGTLDEDDALDAETWYVDSDGDGYHDPAGATTTACDQPSGYADDSLEDCNDGYAELTDCDCSSAWDGDFHATADTTLDGGVYEYDSFVIDSGVTVTVTGHVPLVIHASEVDISGALEAVGEDGVDSDNSPATPGDGGDGVAGGGGGGGASTCGNGNGTGGEPNGSSVSGYTTGGKGGLPYGLSTDDYDVALGGGWGPGGGGGGGGHSAAGSDGERSSSGSSYGIGGDPYGDQEISLLTGGAGGGGGGANGGGGGGGGGGVAFFANHIQVSGSIDVSGGDGGEKLGGSCTSGGGGGGAGGTLWLHGDVVDVSGSLTADGGIGAPDTGDTDQYGGDGADGWIRVSALNSSVTGTVSPSEYTDATAPACDRDEHDVYDVQDGSETENTYVNIYDATITAVESDGFFMQEDAGGPESGIWVSYTSGDFEGVDLAEGDRVDVYGEYAENSGNSEIDANDGWITWIAEGRPIWPEVVTLADLTDATIVESYEGVLVHVEDFEVSDGSWGSGVFSLESDTVFVGDYLWDWSSQYSPSSGDTFTDLIGPLWDNNGQYEISPRDADDVTSGS